MSFLNLEGMQGNRICAEILKLDSTIIFASIGSMAGIELASAESPSMTVLVGRNPKLKQRYCSLVATVVNTVKESQELLGKSTSIISNYAKNLRLMVIPIYAQSMFVFLITNRESESRNLAYQVYKVLQKFETTR
jgi:hypothetical protein